MRSSSMVRAVVLRLPVSVFAGKHRAARPYRLGGDSYGSFFSGDEHPPPGRRHDSAFRSGFWASSCLQPQATVPAVEPSTPGYGTSCPNRLDGTQDAGEQRRWRSSSSWRTATIAARSWSGRGRIRCTEADGAAQEAARLTQQGAHPAPCSVRVGGAMAAAGNFLEDHLRWDACAAASWVDVRRVQLEAELPGWNADQRLQEGGEQGAGGREPHGRNDHSPC